MEHRTDNMEGSENTEASDSAYYKGSNNGSNNSQSRSHSSKSTASKSLSQSSRSSGYGGAPTTTGGSSQGHAPTDKLQLPEKRIKEKNKTTETNVDEVAETETTEQTNEETVIEKGEIDAARSPSQASPKNESERIEPRAPECTTNKTDDSFACVISMQDGVVIYTTASLTTSLGFPIEMWIGRSFIDFIHPSDRDTFASQITTGLAVPKKVTDVIIKDSELPAVAGNACSNATMMCRVRRYRCLSTGFTIKDRNISYLPFLLNLSFKNVTDEKGTVNYLVIQATQIFSAFKENSELITKAVPFTMRHTASGLLQYIDHMSVPYLGYIPQDIINNDALQLYHRDDLFYITQVYEHIVREGGMPRSKTYRLLAQNGEYLKVETEWSSFINPWSKKLEFVTGKHYVIEGPVNPDVFQSTSNQNKAERYEEQENDEAQSLRGNIVRILTEVLTKPAEAAKQQMSRRCQDIASFMEILLDGQPNTKESVVQTNVVQDGIWQPEHTVMLGGVSPHHVHSDSKSSTGTQSSYSHLNFNENLQRYFSSQSPFTDEMCNTGERVYVNKDRRSNCISPVVTYSGDSGDMSSDSGGMQIPSPLPFGATPTVRLTEMLLTKHNKSMQKEMIKTHSEKRVISRREKKSSSCRQNRKEHMARCNAAYQPTVSDTFEVNQDQLHGVKRVSSVSPPAKATHARHSMQQCFVPPKSSRHLNATATATTATSTLTNPVVATTWSNNSMNMNVNAFIMGIGIPRQMSFKSPIGALSVQCMMYGQTIGLPVMYPFGIPPELVQCPDLGSGGFGKKATLELDYSNYEEACKHVLPMKMDSEKQDKPQSELKAILSKNVMSRDVLHSTNALNRSNEAVPEWQLLRGVHQKPSDENRNSDDTNDRTDGESSYSSFYSSFLRTDSGSNTDCSDKAGLKVLNQQKQEPNVTFETTFIKRRLGAPWTENVNMTPELIYKYEVIPKSLEETLEHDTKLMSHLEQPMLVKEQLEQLYLELQLEGVTARLTLDEGFSSSSSSEDGSPTPSTKVCRKRNYSKYVMIYDEDAPLPPPPAPNEDGTLLAPVAVAVASVVASPTPNVTTG